MADDVEGVEVCLGRGADAWNGRWLSGSALRIGEVDGRLGEEMRAGRDVENGRI